MCVPCRLACARAPIPARRSSSSGSRSQPPRPTTIASSRPFSPPARLSPLTRPSRMRTTRSAIARDGRVVRDDDGGAVLLAHEVGEQRVGEHRVLAVELARRLVGEQQPRPVRERGADGDALLLAAGELRRPGRRRGRRGRRARAARRPARGAPLAACPRAQPAARRARARRGAGRASASSAARRSRARASGTRRGGGGSARRGRRRRRAATRPTAARARPAGAAASTCPTRSGRGSP